MSAKSSLFFAAFGKKAKPHALPDHFAEGGEAEKPEPASEDTSISPEEKLAAHEILEALDGMGDRTGRAEKLAKALKSFFLIVDAQPHEEGQHEDEEMPPAMGEGPY